MEKTTLYPILAGALLGLSGGLINYWLLSLAVKQAGRSANQTLAVIWVLGSYFLRYAAIILLTFALKYFFCLKLALAFLTGMMLTSVLTAVLAGKKKTLT